jgi:hypothetical protein
LILLGDLPERYGPWKTVYNRFWLWSRNGTLTALVVRVNAQAIDELDREVSVDSSIVRAHQHAAGARKALTAPSSPGVDASCSGHATPDDHAIEQRMCRLRLRPIALRWERRRRRGVK